MGGQSAGSVPFGSGSLTHACSNSGPGDGTDYGSYGIHCLDNINDDYEGNDNSWIMTTAYSVNGKYFAGVRFPAVQYIRGIRISRDAFADGNTLDRYSAYINVYVTRPGIVPHPTYTTDPSLWQCVGVIPPRASRGFFWYTFPTELDASSIIVEPLNPEDGEGGWQAIDEIKVYARVGSVKCMNQLCTWM